MSLYQLFLQVSLLHVWRPRQLDYAALNSIPSVELNRDQALGRSSGRESNYCFESPVVETQSHAGRKNKSEPEMPNRAKTKFLVWMRSLNLK